MEVKPDFDDVTLTLENPVVEDAKSKGRKMEERHNAVFVINVSGSMGINKQYDPVSSKGQRTGTFINRLNAVKRAAAFQMVHNRGTCIYTLTVHRFSECKSSC